MAVVENSSIIGEGIHQYELIHDWGKLPSHIRWGKTHAVAIDKQERVFIAHTAQPDNENQDSVVCFNKEGEFQYSFGPQFAGHAHGLSIYEDKEGNELLYLVDDVKGVFKLTLEGELLQHIGKPDFYDEEDLKFGPANVAIADNGDIFLGDGYGSSLILHFNSQGELLNHFGGWGEQDHHSKWAHGVFIAEVDGQQLLHVAVDQPSQIKRFTLGGRFHSVMPGVYQHPRNIFAHKNLWAIPEMQCRLTLIDKHTDRTYHLGDSGLSMDEVGVLRQKKRDFFPQGKFVSAHGLAFFPNGDMIIAEWVEVGRINKLRKI